METSLADTHYYLHISSASVAPWRMSYNYSNAGGTNMTVKHRHSMVIQMIKCTQVHSTWITTAIRNTQNTSPEETNTNPQEYTQEMWMWEQWTQQVQFSRSVTSDSLRPHGQQPTRLLHPWDSPGKSTRVGCHFLLRPYLILGHEYHSSLMTTNMLLV